MGRIIELTYNGKTYKLEFNRRALANMGSDEVIKKQDYDSMVKYVWYAFNKNHPEVSLEQVGEIVEEIGDLESFVDALKQITESAINSLKTSKGNAIWGMKN